MKQSDIFSRERGAEDGRALPAWWRVVPSTAWLVGAVLLAAVLAGTAALFMGTATRSVEITGIVFPQNGIESIKSRREGIISTLQVEVGEMVEAGELIAVVPSTRLLEEIEAAREGGASAQELEVLYSQYQMESMIYTPISGQVVELAEPGSIVEAGDTVAGITKADQYTNESEIRAYVPVGTAQSISKGMDVRVRPQGGAREEYGYLPGLVSGISDYPVTRADVSGALGRFYSDAIIPQSENIVELRVTLLLDQDATQASWGGAGGENMSLDVSTLCSMEVIIAEQTLWEWLLS